MVIILTALLQTTGYTYRYSIYIGSSSLVFHIQPLRFVFLLSLLFSNSIAGFISLGRAGFQCSHVFMVISTVDPDAKVLQRARPKINITVALFLFNYFKNCTHNHQFLAHHQKKRYFLPRRFYRNRTLFIFSVKVLNFLIKIPLPHSKEAVQVQYLHYRGRATCGTTIQSFTSHSGER